MLKYIAKMPCRFCGNPFEIGDTIPTDLIEPSRIHALTREGVIVQIEISPARMKRLLKPPQNLRR